MGFQFDVKAKTMTNTGATGIGLPRARIKSVYFVAGTAGYISFTDGGSSGTELLRIATPASTAGNGSTSVLIPGDGIVFLGDPYLTISGPTSVTFFYG
jgi:hypothetical protein